MDLMYCPNCAAPLSDDQKFCRTCGSDLRKVSQVLGEMIAGSHLADEPGESESMTDERSLSRQAIFERRGTITILVALLVGCLIPIIVGINMYYPGLTPLILILAGLAGIILFSGVILVIYGERLSKEPLDRDFARPAKLPQAAQTNQLPTGGHPENVPSVTEGTTDLLGIAKVKGETHLVGKKDE
jgi:hypothetical protein